MFLPRVEGDQEGPTAGRKAQPAGPAGDVWLKHASTAGAAEEQRRKDLEFRVPIPRDATASGACGLWRRSDTQSSAHRSWGDTEDPCCFGRPGNRGEDGGAGPGHPHTDAQSFAHRSWATQDPTARRPAIPSGRGTQRARHLATRNPLRIGPRDTQDRLSSLHAHFLLRAAGEQEKNGPRSSRS